MQFSVRIWTDLTSSIQVPVAEHSTASHQEVELKRILQKFIADESGATAIEYGLIAAGISLAIIAAVNGLGSNVNTKFTSINTGLN
jgi:pilus assembly protein Flp/PilA